MNLIFIIYNIYGIILSEKKLFHVISLWLDSNSIKYFKFSMKFFF